MKRNILVIILLLAVVAIGFNKTFADGEKAKLSAPAKIAVVNVRYVLQNIKANTEFVKQMTDQTDQIQADLKALSDELIMLEKSMGTRVKGSSDYMKIAKELMEKEAIFNAQREFQKNLMVHTQKQWTEEIYKTINEKIAEVASAKKIDIVLDGNADLTKELPAPTFDDLFLTIRTRSVLYFNDSVDITQEVIEAVDNAK